MAGSEPKRWLVPLLAVISAGVGFLAYHVPPSGRRLGGGFLLAIGAMNILFHRKIGRQVFDRAHSMRPIVARFWDYGGEKGTQLLYLGIGVILAIAGCVLLIESA